MVLILGKFEVWFHGVMVSTPDSESGDPSSSLGGTFGIGYLSRIVVATMTHSKATNFKARISSSRMPSSEW